MKNISLNGESIELHANQTYIFIDGVYLNDVKSQIDEIDTPVMFSQIKEKIFPYTSTPFALYEPNDAIFDIQKIKKGNYSETSLESTNFFSTDTGLIIVIRQEFLLKFLPLYDYEELVDSSTHPINLYVWERLTLDYDFRDVGLILSPGVNSIYDFKGSGVYKIL